MADPDNRITAYLDQIKDLPLYNEIMQHPKDKRPGLLKTFALLGVVHYHAVMNGRGIDIGCSSAGKEDNAVDKATTLMSLDGAID